MDTVSGHGIDTYFVSRVELCGNKKAFLKGGKFPFGHRQCFRSLYQCVIHPDLYAGVSDVADYILPAFIEIEHIVCAVGINECVHYQLGRVGFFVKRDFIFTTADECR